MKQFFKYMFASALGVFVAFLLIFFVMMGVIGSAISSLDSKKEVKVKKNSVLHVSFDTPIIDRTTQNPFENFDFSNFKMEKSLGLNDILANIEKAKKDDNIKGLYLDVTKLQAGMATVEEIRNALVEFKEETDKFLVCYGEVFPQGAYYLASTADEVWLNPEGIIEFKGLGAQLMFFKGALEKLQIEPQVIRYGKFKSAVEPFILEKMSEANREQTEKYIRSLWMHMLENIAESRGLTVEQLNKIADEALVRNAEDAVEQKLADKLMYKDQVIDELKDRLELEAKDEIEYMGITKYNDAPEVRTEEEKEKGIAKDKVAVIYALGSIESGEGDEQTIGSERVSKAIRKARKDSTIKSIVLRVNSPGGSALASDVIWREVVLAKKEKPVVVSMGDVAASGGYYISCAADKIFASPNTITGSIGVFGLLFNLKEMMNDKLGVTVDTVNTNKYANIGTPFRSLTEAEREIIQEGVNEIYHEFVEKVAEGRGMKWEEVDKIGQGRVWSGVDALEIGLVDELGGMEEAIAAAAELAELEHYRTVDYPEQEDPMEKLMKEITGKGEEVLLKRQMGEHYKYYKSLQEMLKMEGIQARLPYDIYIN